jgi:hypothetical protein
MDNEVERGLQAKPFDWAAWDRDCEAKGLCQGYESVPVPGEELDPLGIPEYTLPHPHTELHHRVPTIEGLAEPYWQCPHCRQLQRHVQWIQGARLIKWDVDVRGHRTVVWVKVSTLQWYVLVTHSTLQGVARGCLGAVYAVGNCVPLQLPEECATILARRLWYRLTKGAWSKK